MMLHGSLLRLMTTTCSMLGVFFNASSAMALSGMILPPRKEQFAVMSSLQVESLMRSDSESALKPPNTMEWMAPMRVQASITVAASAIIGR